MSEYPLLQTINDPGDLKTLETEQLVQLAEELRQFIVQSVSETGGHFAASLGTVELTIALHHVFNTPDDRLVWDVGHQCYGHKILTGRRDRMSTIRQWQGLSGFPKRSESPYDAFDVGHAGTSISAALGMAIANARLGTNNKSIAVIGDGGMTSGMAFEALNHAGAIKANMLVILNDNKMSISENVGGMSRYLAKLIAGSFYLSVRRSGKRVLKGIPALHDFARRWEEHMKGMVLPGTLFEELGFNYIGPIEGHDLPSLIRVMKNIQELDGPHFLHLITTKGKGYEPAEENPSAYHGVTRFDPETGKSLAPGKKQQSYTEVFGEWITAEAETNDRLMAITPAMGSGSGLNGFAEKYPERFLDVGIAEQHAVTLAGGMACEGIHPVVAIYSTFMQRAFDQVVHDVALMNSPVLFAVDRAGLVGPDGATHAGNYDISYLRCIPNLVIMAPANAEETRQMLSLGMAHKGPAVVRYPRDQVPEQDSGPQPVEFGKGTVLREGTDVAILAFGHLTNTAYAVAERLNATLVNMRFVKPLDEKLLLDIACNHQCIVSVEENAVAGGAGSAIAEVLNRENVVVPHLQLGIPDELIEQGTRDQLLASIGLDEIGIENAIRVFIQRNCIKLTTQVVS